MPGEVRQRAGQVVLGHWAADAADPDEVAVALVDPATAHRMSGVICRCTGGRPVAEAVSAVARSRR